MTVAEIIAVIFTAVFCTVLLALFLYGKIERTCAEMEQQEQEKAAHDEPCETCLRWSECNGVDEQCPRRKENGKNEQD